MKIGLLLCGDVPSSLKGAFGDYAKCLADRFGLGSVDDMFIWNVYQNEIPGSADLCDVYIVGGSPAGVHDELKWISELSGFIQRAFEGGKKLLGVCFGHQLVNHALGGVVGRPFSGWGLGAGGIHSNSV